MSLVEITAEEAREARPDALALIPYTSTVTAVSHPELLPPPGYPSFLPSSWESAISDRDICLSQLSRYVCQAARNLYRGYDHVPTIVAAGEHTFGPGHVSTSDLMYRFLEGTLKVPRTSFTPDRPLMANTTTHQVRWLAEWQQKHEKEEVQVLAYREHIPRVIACSRLDELNGTITAVEAVLGENGHVARQIKAFNEGNRKYEQQALRAVQLLGRFGSLAVYGFFDTSVRLATANVVDVEQTGHNEFAYRQERAYARVRRLAKEAARAANA